MFRRLARKFLELFRRPAVDASRHNQKLMANTSLSKQELVHRVAAYQQLEKLLQPHHAGGKAI